MVKETAIKIARDYISHIPEEITVITAFLFGSYAIGNQSEESDIDVAVVTGSSNNIFDIQMQHFRIRRRIDLRIEPHAIREEDFSHLNPLAEEIMQSGIELI